MDSTNWLSRLTPRERASVGIFLALLFLGSGILAGRLWGGSGEVVVEEAPPAEPVVSSAEEEEIYVHVCGQVKNPGVYKLPSSSRVFQALERAGGPTEKADLEFLNLAQKLADGEKVYVPAKGEVPAPEKLVGTSRTAAAGSKQTKEKNTQQKLTGKININTADSEKLQLLPGVGPAIAQRILDYRQQIGRFTSIEQLLEVSGIGPKTLERIREHVEL